MNKLIGIVITIIFTLIIFLVSKDIIYNINIIEEVRVNEETFIALNYSHQYEDLDLELVFIDITEINVNGFEKLPIEVHYTILDEDSIRLKTSTSNINDVIIITYTYWYIGENEDVSDSLENMMNIIPVMILITVISSFTYVKMKKTKV